MSERRIEDAPSEGGEDQGTNQNEVQVSNSSGSAVFPPVQSSRLAQVVERTKVGQQRVGRFWIGTIPIDSGYTPTEESIEGPLIWLKGQKEVGESGYEHYQLVAGFKSNQRLTALKKIFGAGTHWELTRSNAAESYVWKEETRVAGSQFEYGTKPIKRNCSKDWDAVLSSAKEGKLEEIPADILIRCYSQITRIAKDFMVATPIERTVEVFWGRTESGKSRKAWDMAGWDAYPKDPSTKWYLCNLNQ